MSEKSSKRTKFSNFFKSKSPTTSWSRFKTIFNSVIDECIPLEEFAKEIDILNKTKNKKQKTKNKKQKIDLGAQRRKPKPKSWRKKKEVFKLSLKNMLI